MSENRPSDHLASAQLSSESALRLEVFGLVQGVGFRPFVYNLANSLGLGGSVCNKGNYVEVFIVGGTRACEEFITRLDESAGEIEEIKRFVLNPKEFRLSLTKSLEDKTKPFSIILSEPSDAKGYVMPRDVGICASCKAELFDTKNYRYFYPFITCSVCGPRFSIIECLPYDREHTAMRDYPMCPRCRAEYDDPTNPRFYAQSLSCKDCGMELSLYKEDECIMRAREADEVWLIFKKVAKLLEANNILAFKGLGGYALICNTKVATVAKLRKRKHRPLKPLALMCKDIAMAKGIANITPLEESALRGKEAPIIILPLKSKLLGNPAFMQITGGLKSIGIMLANQPSQLLLFDFYNAPIIYTSANISGEVIASTYKELPQGVADLVLSFNREIINSIDDSVMIRHEGGIDACGKSAGSENENGKNASGIDACGEDKGGFMVPLRLARGYAPLSLSRKIKVYSTIGKSFYEESSCLALGVGAQLKSSVGVMKMEIKEQEGADRHDLDIESKSHSTKPHLDIESKSLSSNHNLGAQSKIHSTKIHSKVQSKMDLAKPNPLDKATILSLELCLSPYIGDLESISVSERFGFYVELFSSIYKEKLDFIAHDAHPQYYSSEFAKEYATKEGISAIPLPHHLAHFYALAFESLETEESLESNKIDSIDLTVGMYESFLCLVFDGLGLGENGRLFGGEVYFGNLGQDIGEIKRPYHLEYFPLIAGDASSKYIDDIALALMLQSGVSDSDIKKIFASHNEAEAKNIEIKRGLYFRQRENGTFTLTSSMGRVFDGVAALLDLSHLRAYDAHSAYLLEAYYDREKSSFRELLAKLKDIDVTKEVEKAEEILRGMVEDGLLYALPFRPYAPSELADTKPLKPREISLSPLVRGIVHDVLSGVNKGEIATRFYDSLGALMLRLSLGQGALGLSGGCFASPILAWYASEIECFYKKLGRVFKLLCHKELPLGDGSIAAGQAVYGALHGRSS